MSVHETASGWQIDRRDHHNQRVRKTFASEGAARAFNARMEAQVQQARATMRNFVGSIDMKLGEAVNDYLAGRVTAQGTRRRETQALNTFVREFGNKPLDQITPRGLAQYQERRKLILAPWTAYREACWLRSVFGWLIEHGYIPSNPVAELPRPHAPHESRARSLTYGETRELIQNLGSRLMPRALVALDTGASTGELHQLRVRHISLDERSIDINPVKVHAFRRVPMTARLEEEISQRLRGAKNPDAVLFSYATRQIQEKSLSHLSHLCRMRVSFHFRFHDLRHTFGTRIGAVAQRHRIQQYLLGHHPVTPTEKYDHPTPEELRTTIDQMDAARQIGEQTA